MVAPSANAAATVPGSTRCLVATTSLLVTSDMLRVSFEDIGWLELEDDPSILGMHGVSDRHTEDGGNKNRLNLR